MTSAVIPLMSSSDVKAPQYLQLLAGRSIDQRAGRLEEARLMFEKMLGYANPEIRGRM
jgi:hypothetical protein